MVFCHVAHSPDLWAFVGGFTLVLLGAVDWERVMASLFMGGSALWEAARLTTDKSGLSLEIAPAPVLNEHCSFILPGAQP